MDLNNVLLRCELTNFIFRKYIKGKLWNHPEHKMTGKVVIITGANSGIGKETALDLAKRGAKVYMACRDQKRGETAQREVISASGNNQVYYRNLDLASLDSVRDFVEKFKKEENRLDVLINNAGLVFKKYKETKDGFEMQMGVNHLGHFLLTNLLLDLLKKSKPSRIINVSSVMHYFGSIDQNDLMMRKRNYFSHTAYSNTKLANLLFMRELSKRLSNTGVTVNSLHPGAVRTEIWKTKKTFQGQSFEKFMAIFFKTAYEGAQTTIRCAVDPELEKITGKYFS